MKTISHIRISTNKQDEASQRHIIAGWLEQNPCSEFSEVCDTTSGGVPWQERQLGRILADCKRGDRIVVSEVSRIARSMLGVLTFMSAAVERGVEVVAIKSGIKLDNSMQAKIVLWCLAMVAEIDRDLLRERTTAALQARKQRGLAIGRQPGALGKRNKLQGKETEIDQLKKAKVSDSAIARVLGVSRGTLATFQAMRAQQSIASQEPESLRMKGGA